MNITYTAVRAIRLSTDPFDIRDASRLWKCDECSALVLENDQEKHATWHGKMLLQALF